MFSKRDQKFQKYSLCGIEVDWIAQSLWSGLEKNLFVLQNGYILTFLEIYPIASRHNHAGDLRAIN
jgi:hypothetical protein